MTGTPLRTPAPTLIAENPGPRKHRKWPLALVGVVVLGAAGTAAWAFTGRHSSVETAAAQAKRAGANQGAAGNQANQSAGVKVGDFSFAAGKTRCDVHSVGPADLAQRPKGMFCLVDVAVTNSGSEAELLDGGPQRAVDSQGHEYPIADAAAVFVNDGDPTILNEIEPGATVNGTLPFDVPAGTRITALMLHDSMTSNGVRVALS